MAGTTTDYTIGVKSIYDATGLKTGVTNATAALNTLETEVSSSALAMDADLGTVDTSIGSTFGTGGTLDQSADSVINTSGRKLKAAGSQIGQDFAQNLTTGISSGDVTGTVTGLFSSLAAVGGIAAVGVGLGAALITGLVKGAKEREAEYRAAISDLMAAGEAEAEQSAKQIQRSLFEAFDVQTALSQFGDGDVSTGIERVNSLVEETGLAFNDVVDIIRGQEGPAVEGILHTLQDQLEAGTEQVSVHGQVGKQLSAQAKAAEELLAHYEEQNGKLDEAVSNNQKIAGYQRTQRDYVREITGNTAANADQTERYAAAMERADAAARLLAGRRLPSSDILNGTG